MQRIYSVMIKGTTLESWDLKELLARAVTAKKKPDPQFVFRGRFDGQAHSENASELQVATGAPV
jgi:hypothetical protein